VKRTPLTTVRGVRGGVHHNTLYTSADIAELKKTYENGGVAWRIVAIYALLISRRGWVIETIDDNPETLTLAEEIRDMFEDLEIDSWLTFIISQAIVYGHGVCEVLWDGDTPVEVLKRDGSQFVAIQDDYGRIKHFLQNGVGAHKEIPPEALLWVTAIDSYDPNGVSVLKLAFDGINVYKEVRQSIKTGIYRHGTPKVHHQLGREDQDVTEVQVDEYAKGVKDVSPDDDYVTSHDINIKPIDTQPVEARQYHEFGVLSTSVDSGIPAEMLGIRIGTTDNTAISRMDAFRDEIYGYQATISNHVTKQVVNRYIGKKGVCWFIFEKPSVSDLEDVANIITKLMAANPLNPFWVGEDWIREQLKLPPKERGTYNATGFKSVETNRFLRRKIRVRKND